MIPYGRQDITESDIQAVVDVLQSEFLTQGPIIERFEQRVANYCGASNALALNSSTSSLHLACLALDVGPGDIVWTSPISFVASSNCALYCGADIDFVDIDPITYNICCDKLAEKLRAAKLKGTLPKVVIPVHLTGQSCDMEKYISWAQSMVFELLRMHLMQLVDIIMDKELVHANIVTYVFLAFIRLKLLLQVRVV